MDSAGKRQPDRRRPPVPDLCLLLSGPANQGHECWPCGAFVGLQKGRTQFGWDTGGPPVSPHSSQGYRWERPAVWLEIKQQQPLTKQCLFLLQLTSMLLLRFWPVSYHFCLWCRWYLVGFFTCMLPRFCGDLYVYVIGCFLLSEVSWTWAHPWTFSASFNQMLQNTPIRIS